MVTVCGSELCPMIVGIANVTDVGVSVSVGGEFPVPDNCVLCVPASSTNVSAPVAGPATVGANATFNWQSELAANDVVPQTLLTSTNGPDILILVIATAVPPLFSAVTCRAVDWLPTCVCPKSMVAGISATTPGVSPVPVSATVSFPAARLAAMVSWPSRSPDTLGVNVIWIVQLAPALIVAFRQLSVSL